MVRPSSEVKCLPELEVRRLVNCSTVSVTDTVCQGTCVHKSREESCSRTQLVFPYRGTYVRHIGTNRAIADGNQLLFFNAGEAYRVSHPIPGGDRNVTLTVDESHLAEIAPTSMLQHGHLPRFRQQSLQIDTRTQAHVALLRHRIYGDPLDPLAIEVLAFEVTLRALNSTAVRGTVTSSGRRLVERIKLLLASDVSRRWSLAEVGLAVQRSPVYLTQLFQRVEGMPLYRYQLRLRLARALDLLGEYDDLTTLSLEVGFSSHSHFSAAFRDVYGISPSEFKRSALGQGLTTLRRARWRIA
jgi:AraC family transcriptional regulator